MTRRPVPKARLGDRLTSDRGLTAAEVGEHRQRYGPNDILETPPQRLQRSGVSLAERSGRYLQEARGG